VEIRGNLAPHSALGIIEKSPYVQRVIGFLRFIGLLNAAVGFGAAIFLNLAVVPAVFSRDMESLLRMEYYPYFSGAILQILTSCYFLLQILCAIVALLHLAAEWLYLGKSPRKLSLGLVIGLLCLGLFGGTWVQPALKRFHTIRYAANTSRENRDAARRSFAAWYKMSQGINFLILGGFGFYFWRQAIPPDPIRFR